MKTHLTLSALALCTALGAAQFTHAQNIYCPDAQGRRCTIDDFSTGPYKKIMPTSTAVIDINVQRGKMTGGLRETVFEICHQVPCNAAEDEFGQTASVQIRPSKSADVSSALVFSAGYRTIPRLDIFYGVDGSNIVPLHLDLTPYDRLRVTFDGLNSSSAFNLELFSPTGSGILPCPLGQPHSIPFTVDMPLAEFVVPIDFSDITYMNLINEGGVLDLGTLGFAITKFEAIPPGDVSTATITCSSVSSASRTISTDREGLDSRRVRELLTPHEVAFGYRRAWRDLTDWMEASR
jgi:hypothetical protein